MTKDLGDAKPHRFFYGFREEDASYVPKYLRDPLRPIPENDLRPHYKDKRYHGGTKRTVFLAEGLVLSTDFFVPYVEGAKYDYWDRLLQFNQSARSKAWRAAQNSGLPENSPAYFEVYLQALTGNPTLRVVHIVTSVNTQGWPEIVFGFVD